MTHSYSAPRGPQAGRTLKTRPAIALFASALLTIFVGASSCNNPVEPEVRDLEALETRLSELREQYGIPALSAGISSPDDTVWVRGFGRVSSSDPSPPTSSSVFHLASLTKTFAAAVVLQLANEGRLSLDDLASKYGVHFSNSIDIRVRHLLSHTSEGVPGQQFRYNGNRFAELDKVVQIASGKSFAQLAVERIIDPLSLSCTGPSSNAALRAQLVPGFNAAGRSVQYPTQFGTAAGMVSCVADLLTYSKAWDTDQLLPAASRTNAFTATTSAAGAVQPYGLGWFVTQLDGQKVVWHYGLWTGNSALIIKLPEKSLTFVLLANNEELGRRFTLGAGELLSSPFARVFLAWALQREVRP